METVRIPNGATEKIVTLFYDKNDNPLTGQTIPLSIWRESNGEWYTGSGWQVAYITFNMTESEQGYYYYDFNTTGLNDDTYHLKAKCSNADCVNPIVGGELKVGYHIDDIINILADTNELQGLIADSKISSQVKGWDDINLTAKMKTDVNAECDTALTDYDAPTKAEMTNEHSTINTNILSRSSHSASDVWAVGTRTLTSFGTLIADIWSYATRTLSSFGSLVSNIWGYSSRGLTETVNLSSASETQIDSIEALCTYIKKLGNNRMKIDENTNTLIIYDDDNINPLVTFNLKDSAGDPAHQNIYERVPQ